MKQLVWAALISASSLWAQQQSPPARGYVSQIASGGGWKTTLTLFNPTSGQSQVSVLFHADDGSELLLPLVVTQGGVQQTQTSTELNRTLQPLATLVIESEAPPIWGVLTGWAEVLSRTGVRGSAIFSQQYSDGRSVEAIAPVDFSILPSMVMTFDNREGAATGVALVNPTINQVNVIVRARNENGIELSQRRVSLPARGHTAFVIGERFPELAGQQGTIEFLNPIEGLVTGLGLRFSASGGFTSVPMVHLAEPLASQP